MKVVARFPNQLKQVRIQHPKTGEQVYMIVDANDEPIISTYFTGVVYLNEELFEVYQGAQLRKIGLLHIKNGLDWETPTPNTIYNEESSRTQKALRWMIQEKIRSHSYCPCVFPRIIDYITNRGCHDSRLLRQLLIPKFFKGQHYHYDSKSEIDESLLICKNCTMVLKHSYKERGIDQIEIIDSSNLPNIGKPVKEEAPAYLAGIKPALFYNKSYIFRQNLYKASLEEMLSYLFEKEEV